MRFWKWLLLTIVLAIPACSSATAGATTPPVEPTQPSSNGDNLINTQWKLVSFGPPGSETPVVEGSAVTLEFKGGSQAGGNGGCNSYGGQYKVQDKTLSFDQVASTLMACADEHMMQQEQQYFEALQTTGQFELMDDHLKIWYDDGQNVLNFVSATF